MNDGQGAGNGGAMDRESRVLRVEGRLQRAGWWVIALVLAAALAGLLGHGPLSAATARAPGSALWVEYHRFERHLADTEIRVHAGPAAARDGRLRLELDRAWVEGVEISRIDPEPLSTAADGEHQTLVFAVDGEAATVTIRFRPESYGRLHTRIAAPQAGAAIHISQFSFP